jgi:outer membrane protein assembly factor BamB
VAVAAVLSIITALTVEQLGSGTARKSSAQAVIAASPVQGTSLVSPRSTSGTTAIGESAPLSASAPPSGTTRLYQPWLAALRNQVGHLRPGSRPQALGTDLLIVDKLNNRLIVVDPSGRIRWQFPQPGDLAPGQTFLIPDDAFFSPDGKFIIATQEDQAVITLIDIAKRQIVYRYGVPGVSGSGPNHLSNPDDAMLLPNRDILTPDIKNCRILLISPGTHMPKHVYGLTTTACRHDPPRRWGSPNGAFPLPSGHYLVTEINGDWINEIALNGTVYWSAHAPGVGYPSDTNQVSPNRYLTVDYSSRGQVVEFNRNGTLLWRFTGSGADRLNHPSLALPLPNGNVVLNDDYNHRVIVIDPRTNNIVWQYGVTGVPGSGPGYLDNPDGLDLVPPESMLITHAKAIATH